MASNVCNLRLQEEVSFLSEKTYEFFLVGGTLMLTCGNTFLLFP
jgi:hypothetical protein